MALAVEQVPAPFSPAALARGWQFLPLVMIPVLVIGLLYMVGYRRVRRQPRPVFPRYRAWCFLASLAALIAAVDGPLDTYSDVDLAVHMGQHLVLLYVVAPLAVLGAPVTVALRALSPPRRSRFVLPILRSRVVQALSNPWVAAGLFTADMFGTHFTPFYNLSLENEYIHDCEHLSFLIAGILLWTVILGVEPIRSRQHSQARMLAILALMPVMAIIAAVFALAPNPLYPFYPALPPPWGGRAFAMASQSQAAAVMWLPSPFVTMTALIYIARGKAKTAAARRRRAAGRRDHPSQPLV